jgi:hypothetical protein
MPGAAPSGLAKLNPYYGQLGPEEQKAARQRAILGTLAGMAKSPGAGLQYGLGALDDVVNTAYTRAEREKAQKRQEEQDKATQEYRERTEERLRAAAEFQQEQADKAEERARAQLEMSRENQQRAREDQEYQRKEIERQEKERARVAELEQKAATGSLTPQEQMELYRLGGGRMTPPGGMSPFGMMGMPGLGNGGSIPNPDDDILRAGAGAFNPPR